MTGGSKNGLPKFSQFLAFLVEKFPPKPHLFSEKFFSAFNPHWRPVHVNCDPCKMKYNVVMKVGNAKSSKK